MATFHCSQSKPEQKCQVSTPTGNYQIPLWNDCTDSSTGQEVFKLSAVSSDKNEIKLICRK